MRLLEEVGEIGKNLSDRVAGERGGRRITPSVARPISASARLRMVVLVVMWIFGGSGGGGEDGDDGENGSEFHGLKDLSFGFRRVFRWKRRQFFVLGERRKS